MVLLGGGGSAWAQPRWGVDLDLHGMLGFGDFCQSGGDLTSCSPAQGAPGAGGSAVWFATPRVAVGAGSSFHWLPNDSQRFSDRNKRMWHLFASGRWYQGKGFWAEGSFGLATISDAERTTGNLEPTYRVSQRGVLGGARGGFDWPLTSHLSVGVGGGLLLTIFPSNPAPLRTPSDPDGVTHSYGRLLWVDLFLRTSVRF